MEIILYFADKLADLILVAVGTVVSYYINKWLDNRRK